MRATKYNTKYGYASGGSLGDMFRLFSPLMRTVAKKAATNLAVSGLTAVGDRVGSKLANKLAPKPIQPRVDPTELLKGLKLDAPDPGKLGFGRKVRGGGIRILQ